MELILPPPGPRSVPLSRRAFLITVHFIINQKACLKLSSGCINGERLIASDDIQQTTSAESQQTIPEKPAEHKTGRDPNLKLRFEVLKRDHFACRICGASPAKGPSVELHIDHIIPWGQCSRGPNSTSPPYFSQLRRACRSSRLAPQFKDLWLPTRKWQPGLFGPDCRFES